MERIKKITTLRTIETRLYDFIWGIDSRKRTWLCISLGLATFAIAWWFEWSWQVAFLCGWIITLTTYLGLLGIIVFTADSTRTRERVVKLYPQRWPIMMVVIFTAYVGTSCVGFILHPAGQSSAGHFRLLVGLSVIAVVLSWLLLNVAFGLLYARLYYDRTDTKRGVLPEDMRRGFIFTGIPDPTYEDFFYVSFTIGLTYSVSDVKVTGQLHKRLVIFHGLISLLFYTTILAVILNAVMTS